MHHADTGIFDHIIVVNLRGVFLCLKHEIAAMLEFDRWMPTDAARAGLAEAHAYELRRSSR